MDSSQPVSFGSQSLSYSRRSTWDECQVKFNLKYNKGLEKKGGDSQALRMGSAYHHALEHRDPSKVAEYYEPFIYGAVEYQVPILKYEGKVVGVLSGMGVRHLEQHILGLGDASVHSVDVEVNTLPIAYRHGGVSNGRIDVVIKKNGHLHIIDHKLLSQFSERDARNIQMHPQLLTYAVHASQQYGVEPEKIICTLAVTKKPQVYKRKDEVWSDYTERVISKVNEDPGKYTVWATTKPYTEYEFEKFHNDMLIYDKEIMNERNHDSDYKRNLNSCGNYGGCEFIPVCHASNAYDLERIINDEYISSQASISVEQGTGGDGECS